MTAALVVFNFQLNFTPVHRFRFDFLNQLIMFVGVQLTVW